MKKVNFYYPLDCILKKERFTTYEQSHKQANVIHFTVYNNSV